MATITIAADGSGDYTAPNSNAYAALDGGAAANTVNWKPGVYVPTTGRWWGLTAANAFAKRATHQVVGSGSVVLDARVFVPLVASPSVTWSSTYGCWRIELFTDAAGGTIFEVDSVWFGAETGSTASDIVIGDSYRPADSLAQVNADGLTLAGMSAGNGIWFATSEASTVSGGATAQVLYVWCPLDDAQIPALQWGGIAACASQNGSPSAGTPRYGAFVFGRRTADGANDPSGSVVDAGFICIAAGRHLIGSASKSDSNAAAPVSDILYTDIVGYGASNWMYIGAQTAGHTLTNYRLEGDWSYDDARDPATYPIFGTIGVRAVLFFENRAKTIEVDGGAIVCGDTHGAIQISCTGASPPATAEERPNACSVTGTSFTARAGAQYARTVVIGNCDDTTVARCTFTGFTTRGQCGGIGTLVHGSTFRGLAASTEAADQSSTVLRVRTGDDDDPTAVRVRWYANTIDLRGSDADVTWSAFDLVAYSPDGVSAGTIDARDNVTLLEAGQAIFRTLRQSGGAGVWDTDQTWIGGFSSGSVQAYDGGADSSVPGTATTLASLFSTGTVVAPTTDTSGNILTRGDTPIMRYALETAGATSS